MNTIATHSNAADVIVVGGGIIGVTSAYELASRGYRTALVEAREGVALETSHANGALLTPSMCAPWNAPGICRSLAASLFSPHATMKLRLSALPSLAGWGVRFLRNSSRTRHAAATRASFVLAKYSVERTRELRERLGLCYDVSTRGTIKVFRDPSALEESFRLASMLEPLGLRFELLGCHATVHAEPALAEIADQIAGSLRFPEDESGDTHKFCEGLVASFERRGGVVNRGTRVLALLIERGIVTGVRLKDRVMSADRVVVAAGNAAADLAGRVGVRLPIRPVKGYTVTFDSVTGEMPTVPVIDDGLHAAVVPLGTRLRVAGTAEFAGPDLHVQTEGVQNLLNLLQAIYPRIAARLDPASGRRWAGLRPMSADGLPFIGATGIPGLYVNSGHGHLGWTQAVGSAHVLADAMMDRSTDIDSSPYRAAR